MSWLGWLAVLSMFCFAMAVLGDIALAIGRVAFALEQKR